MKPSPVRRRTDLRGEEGTGGLCEGQLCVCVNVQESHSLRLDVRGPSQGLRGITHYVGLSHLLLFTHVVEDTLQHVINRLKDLV